MRSSRGFSVSAKRELDFGIPEVLRTSQIVPGPGNYNESKIYNKSTYTFSKDLRMKDAGLTTPGPGSYGDVSSEVVKNKGPKYSMSKSERPKDLFVKSTQGTEFFSQSTYDFRTGFPGPGKYQTDESFSKIWSKTRSVVLLKSTKNIDYNNKIPGPGSYDNNTIKLKQKNPKYSVSKSIREDPFMPETVKKQIEKVPGPGDYNINSSIGTGRKTKVRGKSIVDYENKVPGPGAYNHAKQKILKQSPAWNLKGKGRDDSYFVSKSSLDVPGVGNSPVPTMFNPKTMKGYQFGKSLRMHDERPEPSRYERQ